MIFYKRLINWYLVNKRELPWRGSKDPYIIWLSEIILQQTRVEQGKPYFEIFKKTFPTVFDLAKASEEEILKCWQGLGYYSRARNLHKVAQEIAFNRKGVFPTNYSDLLQLKGVGSYTAGAIASFCYDQLVPVVDGNVFRVLSRVFNIDTDIVSSKAKKEFQDLALALMPKEDPATFNQAIMEFGALQCVPKNPDCKNCIFNDCCAGLQKDKISVLPVKSKKIKPKHRFFNYLILWDYNGNTSIQKRTTKDIWHNLYEFPLIETSKLLIYDDIVSQIQDCMRAKLYDIDVIEECHDNYLIHKLSHQYLNIKFWKVNIKGEIKEGIHYKEILNFPFPIVLYNFINNYWLK